MSEAATIDARGLSCPEPVMLAKHAMRQADAAAIEVIVDSAASRDNVRRAAEMAGWIVTVTQSSSGEFRLDIRK